MRANPTPMRLADPLDYEDARQALRQSAERIRAAEDAASKQITKAADAEAEYRKALARKILELRTGDPARGATEAETLAKGSDIVTAYGQARDIEHGRIKWMFEVLENRRGDRASLHKIVDWSMRVAPAPEGDAPVTYGGRRAS